MSCQKGNAIRTRPQKHKNKTVFKNSLHDTSHTTKFINNIQVSNVCMRCKEIIEWKIKYKKYKPLTQPRTCVKCNQKTVRQAYHVMCFECGKKLGVCTKCVQPKEIVPGEKNMEQQLKLDNEMKALLQTLPERKRRTFLRYLSRGSEETSETLEEKEKRDHVMKKLNSLRVEDEDDFNSDEFSDDDE